MTKIGRNKGRYHSQACLLLLLEILMRSFLTYLMVNFRYMINISLRCEQNQILRGLSPVKGEGTPPLSARE